MTEELPRNSQWKVFQSLSKFFYYTNCVGQTNVLAVYPILGYISEEQKHRHDKWFLISYGLSEHNIVIKIKTPINKKTNFQVMS